MASTDTLVPTAPPLVSLEAFHGIIWAGFGLCVIGFGSRLSIRVLCFGRLFLEDYLMMLSLCLLLAVTILGQLCVGYIYNMVAVENGKAMPSPDFMSETTIGLRAFAVLMILNYIGIWLIKLNFLLFFRRLGNHVKMYRIMWWCVVAFNVAAGITMFGLIDYKCLIPPAEEVIAKCSGPSSAMVSYTNAKVSCVLDAVGDVMIIGFPICITWGCKLGLRKKLALSGIFGLVAFTIVVTIIRGSIFGSVYESISEDNMKQLNVTWIWFWFNIEYDVAFTVGCLVSFRALYTDRGASAMRAKLRERQRQARECTPSKPTEPKPTESKPTESKPTESKPSGFRAKAQVLRDVLLTTFQEWEDTAHLDDDDDAIIILPSQSAGIRTVHFGSGGGWGNLYTSAHSGADSARTLEAKEASSQEYVC